MSRPLPPEIYRRRRIVLVSGVLGVVLVAWFLVRALTGGDAADETSPTSTPTATSTEATDLPAGTVPASLRTGDEACDPQTVRISPSVPADQTAGADVAIVLTVSTTSSTACLLEASAAELVVVIDDGDGPVYDSTSCTRSILSSPISLSPGWATVTTATWSGRVSGAACSDAEAFVASGEYTIKLGTLGGEPGETTFALGEAPPPPAPEPVVPDPAVPDPAVPDPAVPDPAATDPAATDPAADPEAVPVG